MTAEYTGRMTIFLHALFASRELKGEEGCSAEHTEQTRVATSSLMPNTLGRQQQQPEKEQPKKRRMLLELLKSRLSCFVQL